MVKMPHTRKRQDDVAHVGVDPGQNGGLVFLYEKIVIATAMPETERDIWEWFSSVSKTTHSSGYPDVVAVIEKVHSFPKQGLASTFKFGWGYGGLRMAMHAAGIRFEDVPPRTWQKALGISPKKATETVRQWKNRLKAKAQQLFPEVEVMLQTADALLIAEYCRRKNKGLL